MNEPIHLIPIAGLRVVNPATGQPLPPDGETVERDTYWIRRLGDGDVIQVDVPPELSATASATKSAKK
jgi:hypothetical protein